MAVPAIEEYLETFSHAVDSVCKSLQFRLDEDDARDTPPMEDMVRAEIEEELDRMSRLSGELRDEAKGGQAVFVLFVKERKDDLAKALDFYEKRLDDSMKATILKDPYNPAFKRTKRELELAKSARQLLS